MGNLERNIAAPVATPHRISELVSEMSSDTTTPRKLSENLITRLDSIASNSDGKVRLHGRLFAQWMHHAFPNECPFPHEAGTTSPLTPDEWMGTEVSASREERQKIIDEDSCGADSELVSGELPWNDGEELLEPSRSAEQPRHGDWMCLFGQVAVVVLSVYALLSSSLATFRHQLLSTSAKWGLSWQILLVVWLSVISFVTNLVDGKLFLFVICAGLVSNFLVRSSKGAKFQKCDRCLV